MPNSFNVLSSQFEEFIAPDADRFEILCSLIEEKKFPYTVLELSGKRHIVLGTVPDIILTAHYDRTANSPGANDNSVSVFMMLETFSRFGSTSTEDGPLIIFTDGEELSSGGSLKDQGAYSLALYLAGKGLGCSKVFIFDACGVGDSLVISTAAEELLKNTDDSSRFLHKMQTLRTMALEAARKAHLEKVFLIPAPFSDDAGFFRAGIAAQTITVLPQGEAAAFAALSRTCPEAAERLFSSASPPPGDRRLIPETWRSLNGAGDSPLRLTPEHHDKVVRFALSLCGTD